MLVRVLVGSTNKHPTRCPAGLWVLVGCLWGAYGVLSSGFVGACGVLMGAYGVLVGCLWGAVQRVLVGCLWVLPGHSGCEQAGTELTSQVGACPFELLQCCPPSGEKFWMQMFFGLTTPTLNAPQH